MKECDKRKNHVSSKLHMIYISSNNVKHPVTKTFTTLHYTSTNYTYLVAPITPRFIYNNFRFYMLLTKSMEHRTS